VTGNRFRYASHQKPVQAFQSVGAQDDQISAPPRCLLDDFCLGVTSLYDFGRLEACLAQFPRGPLHEFVGLLSAVLLDSRDMGYKMREQIGGHIGRNWFENGQHLNFGPSFTNLRKNRPHRFLREVRFVYGKEHSHVFFRAR
jgi:hypothetical protein